METFDFARVQQAMTVLGWAWHNTHYSGVPTLSVVKDFAAWLMDDVIERQAREGKAYGSSGGFVCTADEKYLRLSFVIESSVDFDEIHEEPALEAKDGVI